MDKLAKGMRVSCGMVMLLNIAAFFLPLTKITQPNYADIQHSQFDYLKGLFQGVSLAGEDITLSAIQIAIIIAMMAVPVLLSLTAGIYGVVGSPRQLFTGIASFFLCILYFALFYFLPGMWPEAGAEQTYEKGLAVWFNLADAGLASVLGIVALIVTPRTQKKESIQIPQVNEIREEQIQAKYNVVESERENASIEEQNVPEKSPGMPPYDPANPKGALVGYTGIYKGAEIPFRDKETIQLGRSADNDLIFEGQGHISRRHCALTWYADRQKFQILDYSSSGSYVNGMEECLPQNIEVWLEPGTVIDFGNEENRFRLE